MLDVVEIKLHIVCMRHKQINLMLKLLFVESLKISDSEKILTFSRK